jgi:hypothetical protein
MNIGISTTATAQSGDLAEVARQVEALGYDSLWIPEHSVVPVHHTTPFPASRDGQMPEHYGRWADPFIALTVAATVTKTIKLGTGICLLPERDPLITAGSFLNLPSPGPPAQCPRSARTGCLLAWVHQTSCYDRWRLPGVYLGLPTRLTHPHQDDK